MESHGKSKYVPTPKQLEEAATVEKGKLKVAAFLVIYFCTKTSARHKPNIDKGILERAKEGYLDVIQNHGRAHEYEGKPSWWGVGVQYSSFDLFIKTTGGPSFVTPLPYWIRKENEKYVENKERKEYSISDILTKCIKEPLSLLKKHANKGIELDEEY